MENSTASNTPKGELALRTLTMPMDTNPHGDVFGGWLVSQMDLAGGIIAKQHAHCRVATIAIDKMIFKEPVQVGETLSVYCDIIRIGRTSISISIQVWSINHEVDREHRQVTEATFTYVAIDQRGKPQPVERA